MRQFVKLRQGENLILNLCKIRVKMKKNSYSQGILMLNFALSFMLCIFATFEAYYTNKEEYWFNIGQVFSMSIIAFSILFIMLSLLSFLMNKVKIGNAYFLVLLSLFLYLYIQGNYIPRNYGVLDGSTILWDQYNGYSIASMILIVVVVVFAALIQIKFKDKLFEIGRILTIFIFLIQLTTMATLFAEDIFFSNGSDDKNYIVTEKNLFDLSSNNNILVFILDTYDSSFFQEQLDNEYEKLSQIFEDFTYYPDTLGAFPKTKVAMPFILTGEWYENQQPYSEYLKMAYDNNDLYEDMEKLGFEVAIYTGTTYLSPNITYSSNFEVGKYKISSKKQFIETIYKLIAFNYAPHQLKKYFVVDTSTFSSLKKSNTANKVFSSNVESFANRISEEMEVTGDGNLFKFIHLQGVHEPYTFDEELEHSEEKEYTYYDEVKGNNRLIEMYIEELKAKGVYDNTTIIIMADHGELQYCQNPVFLIKNAEVSKSFTVSDSKMSYEYLKDIWRALINGKIVDETFIDNYSNNNKERRYLYYIWDGAWDKAYFPVMREFITSGNAYDTDNLFPSGIIYEPNGKDFSYSLGTTIKFIEDLTAYEYVKNGINFGIFNKKASMAFEITNGEYQNIEVEMKIEPSTGNGVLSIYVDDNHIAEKVYGDTDTISFMIPHEYIKDNMINLRFEHPYDNEGDPLFQTSSLRISEMVLYDSKNDIEFSKQYDGHGYQIGDIIYFASDNIYNRPVLRSGFSSMEINGTWTSGNASQLRLILEEVDTDLVVSMKYATFNEIQDVKIYIEDELIDHYVASGAEEHSFVIPYKYFNNGIVDINIELENAISPSEIGTSKDMRRLALYLYSIELSTGE